VLGGPSAMRQKVIAIQHYGKDLSLIVGENSMLWNFRPTNVIVEKPGRSYVGDIL